MNNPFKLATPVAKKLKILLYGPSGSGKTLAALSFPKVALIDAEGGADLYAGRPGIAPFSILRSKTVKELETAIQFIREDGGKTFETLVIDPITVFYDVLKDAAQREREKVGKEMTYRDWSKINQRMRSIYNQLSQLPVHVIAIAREAVEYEGAGDSLRKTGTKADADKAIAYLFDYAVQLAPDHSGTVKKSRGFDIGTKLAKVDWSVFEKASLAFTTGETVKHQSDDDAVEQERDQFADAEPSSKLAMTAGNAAGNGNGHSAEPPADQPPESSTFQHWYDDPDKRATVLNLLSKKYTVTEREAVKLAGKPLREFASGKEAALAVEAALNKAATPKNGNGKLHWSDDPAQMDTLAKHLLDGFELTPDAVLKRLGKVSWKDYINLDVAKADILETATEQNWDMIATTANYYEYGSPNDENKRRIIRFNTPRLVVWYAGRKALVKALDETAKTLWIEVESWQPQTGDLTKVEPLPLPEKVRITAKPGKSGALEVARIVAAEAIPF